MPGPKLPALILTYTERAELERLVRRAHGSRALNIRAGIVLACAEAGSTNTAVARELGVCRPGSIEWRSHFVARRLAACLTPRAQAQRAPCTVHRAGRGCGTPARAHLGDPAEERHPSE